MLFDIEQIVFVFEMKNY